MAKPQYKVINTFSRMPSPAQICSYIVIALESIIFYIMIRPKIQQEIASIVFTVVFSVSLAVCLITSFICSYIDPSDPVMVKQRTGRKKQIQQSPQQLLFCEYCQASVTMNAKHCRQCDRCVQNFDHHCMWINNCVGSRNYKPFIIMITSTCINLGIYLASVVYLSVEKQWTAFMGFIITCWVVMVIVFVLWFLLFNLNLLHFYLMCKGYTTYQFIVARKEEQRVKQYEQAQRLRREKEQKLKAMIQNSKKKIFEANQTKDNTRKTPIKQKNRLKSQQQEKSNDSQQNTNTVIKLQTKQKSKQETIIKQLETTDAKLKTKIRAINTEQNIENVFGVEDNKRSSENSQVQSIKIDNNSIKQERLFNQNELRPVNEHIETESEGQSIRISQFFIRNKSFNFIISNSEAAAPHKKLNNLSLDVDKNKDKQTKEKIKSKSTSSEHLTKIVATKKPSKSKINKK